jgi:subtilase family serine protease
MISFRVVSFLPFVSVLGLNLSQAQSVREPRVLVPESAGWSVLDRDVRAHTHLRVLEVPDANVGGSDVYNTPQMMRSAYDLPNSGGSNAIAVVDAFHYPTALKDFDTFSLYFNLPQETSTKAVASTNPTFQVVYATGVQPKSGGNYISSWNLEAALDIEWAHAMAPGAKVYLVEAASDSTHDLDYAVGIAASLPGVKEVSMSWGGAESAYEASAYDSNFTTPGVVYTASAGDTAAKLDYPAASPNVVACGGTSIKRNGEGTVVSETGWADAGCGPSKFEPRPAFQSGVASVVGTKRGVSDLSFVADPNTGVYVYFSTSLWGENGWWILGGTSVSSPSLAGVINLAGGVNGFAATSQEEEARIYGGLGTSSFRDITSGKDGKYKCQVGYDFVTGVGSPLGLTSK